MRPPVLADAARVSLLAGDYDVASMTAVIPHPYSEAMAAEWIAGAVRGEEGVAFMIDFDRTLIGCTGYRAFSSDHGELGYWIGKPYWGAGFATEAAKALIAHAFDHEDFSHLMARHFTGNDASEHILKKLGFECEGQDMRECLAQAQTVPCLSYRLDRDQTRAVLRRA